MEGLEVVPVSALPEMTESPAREQTGFMTVAQIQKLAKQAGAGIVITGSYYITEKELQFNAKITDVQTGKLISSVSSELGLINKVDSGFTPYINYIHKLRQRVMGVLAAKFDPLMAEILSLRPPTFEAYQEYFIGWEYFARDYNRSIQHFQRAHELDPSFIWPLHMISMIHSNRHEYAESKAVADQIDRKRESITEFDRYVLDFRLANLQGNVQKALGILRLAREKFPGSIYILDTIGLLALRINRPQEALESLTKIDLEAQSKMSLAVKSWSIGRMMTAYHMLGDYEIEREKIQKAEELFPDRIWRTQEVRVMAALGRIERVLELVDDSLAGMANAGSPSNVLTEAVEELRVHGHMEEAQSIADRLVEWERKQMPDEPTESQLRGFAGRLYLAQRWDDAYEIYTKLSENHSASFFYINYIAREGSIAARKGIREEALRISEQLGSIDQPYMFGRPAYLRARIASLLGEKQQAVDFLQQAMREGFRFNVDVIQEQDFFPLKDFPPFQEFIKPKG